jgi:hypothetical protein
MTANIESHQDIMVAGYQTTMYRLADGNVGAHYGETWLERDTEENLRAVIRWCAAMENRMDPREIAVHKIEDESRGTRNDGLS